MPVLMSTPSPAQMRSSIMCSRAERLRLRPWLERMIEEEAIPGLEWLDESAKIVKIPWKHAARHGWTRDKDASLFKEWAIHTKKYDPITDEPKANPKIWKANFRCAINSLPDIEELKDQGKTKGNDAFKVYRLNPKKPKRSKTVSDASVVRKSRKNTKSRSRPVDKTIQSAAPPSQLSIQCSSVRVNVINSSHSQPPPYESVVRGRLDSQQRFQLPTPTPNNRDCLQLNPRAAFQPPPYPTSIHHINPITSSIPATPSTPCSSITSTPTSTPVSAPVSPPVFTFPTAPFMHTIPPTPLNIKQEYPGGGNDDVMSESSHGSGDMTDDELVEMVDQMREDSPLSSPSPFIPVSLENSSWMTSTLDNKQFLSNVGTTKDTASTSTFQSPLMNYPTTSSTFFPFPTPVAPSATHIKDELKPECNGAPCAMEDSQSCYEGPMTSFSAI